MTAGQKLTSTHPSVLPSRRTSAGIPTLSKTTPIRAAQSGIAPFTLENRLNAKVVYHNIAEDMKDCFTGSMPYMEYLNTFHPVSGERPPLPPLIYKVPLPCEENPRSGMSVYDDTVTDVCRAINESGLCPSMIFMDTQNIYIDMNGALSSDDPQGKRKVDCSGMLRPGPDEADLPVEPNFSRMKVAFEFKPEQEDPVVDANPKWSDEKKKEQGYVHQTPNAIHARGQATSYVLHQFNYQPRTHVTCMVFLGKWARLLRYDHSGVVVSERFDWREDNGRLLAEFLYRLEHASAKEEGIDDSVGDVESAFTEEQIAEARKSMQEFSEGMIDIPIVKDTPLRSVTCWDDSKLDADGLPKSRTLIATMPFGVNYSVVGRYTVSFIGYDVQTRSAYWVKDSWPIDRPDEFEKEGATYARLQDAKVPHLAEVECAGEVRWKDNTVQRTRTDTFKNAKWAGLTHNIHPLSHYRILFKDIGRPVTRFSSTLQLVIALFHAIEAHSVAYKKARILHRDISPGNILINRKGDGMLIDWDLALLYDDETKDLDCREPRTSWRTGTWAFLSCALLERPFGKTHELSDDVESFFWVLLYALLRYRYSPVKWMKPTLDQAFQKYLLELFEWREWQYSEELLREVCIGGREKLSFLLGEKRHITKFELGQMQDRDGVQMPKPLRKLVTQLRGDLKKFYQPPMSDSGSDVEAVIADADELPPPLRRAGPSKERARFASSTHLEQRFSAAIAEPGWLEADGASDRFPYIHLPIQTRQKLEKETARVLRTQSDNPESSNRRRTKNDLHYKAPEEQLAADARVRVGGDVILLPRAPSKKRSHEALETVPEEEEPAQEPADERGHSIAMRRRPVPMPTKRRRLGSDDKPLQDGGEAWSGSAFPSF